MNIQALKQKSLLSLVVYGARPKTLVASFFPVILGMLLARASGRYNILIYLSTLFCAAFIQIGTNYANDFFDGKSGRDTSKRLGPPRLTSLGLLPKVTIRTLMIVSFCLASLCSIPLIQAGGPLIIYLMVFAILLGIGYTYGKYSLANTGLSNFTIFAVFGPIGTVMSCYLQTGLFNPQAAFLGIIPGCLSLMMFAMNNLRDMDEDKISGKKTLVVRFGFEWGKKEFLIALFTSWIILPLSMMLYSAPIITLLPLLLMYKGIKLAKKVSHASTPAEIIPLFEETAKYNLLFALAYILSLRIVFAL